MITLHIDTDMGVDDALAITVATRIAGLRVVALSTVFGNVPLDIATRNARLIRHLLAPNLDVPLLGGVAKAPGVDATDARAVHGEDGLGGATTSLDAAFLAQADLPMPVDDDLAKRIKGDRPHLDTNEKVTLVGLGPATNVPALAAWYGSALAEIVLMSGAFFDRGNITDLAEFNAYCDPDALSATLAVEVPITIVPLDICRKVVLSRETIVAWPTVEPAPVMRLLSMAHRHYVDVYRESEGVDGCFPHDTLAVLAAYRPGGFFAVDGEVHVDRRGHLRGRTRLNRSHSRKVKVLTGGDLGWVRKGLTTLRYA